MKKYFLLTIFFIFFASNLGFGEDKDCVDLTKYQAGINETIEVIKPDNPNKIKFEQIRDLFKKCTKKKDFESIEKTFLTMKSDNLTDSSKYIIQNILIQNGFLCVNFDKNTQQGTPMTFVSNLESLIADYEKLAKVKKVGSATYKNHSILISIQKLISNCTKTADLKKILAEVKKIDDVNFGENTKTFKTQMLDLIQNFNKELLNYKEVKLSVPEVEKPKVTNPNPKTVTGNTVAFDIKPILYIIILILAGILAAFGVREYKINQKRKARQEKKPINKAASSNQGNILQAQKLEKLEKDVNRLEQEKSSLVQQIATLTQANESLQSQVNELQKNKNRNVPPIKPSNKPKNTGFNYEEIVFFASPTSNGEFIAKNGQSEVKSGASIYKFYVKGSEAEFEFHNDPSTFKATINDPGNRIKPVCEAKNAYDPSARRIETTRKGKASLQGNKWKVTQQAEIKYEV